LLRRVSSSWRRLRSRRDSSEPDPTGDTGGTLPEPGGFCQEFGKKNCFHRGSLFGTWRLKGFAPVVAQARFGRDARAAILGARRWATPYSRFSPKKLATGLALKFSIGS
jgi:hypothetical protein